MGQKYTIDHEKKGSCVGPPSNCFLWTVSANPQQSEISIETFVGTALAPYLLKYRNLRIEEGERASPLDEHYTLARRGRRPDAPNHDRHHLIRVVHPHD